VARVDVWADAATGLPLKVQLFGEGPGNPALDTRFLDLDLHRPAAGVTAFTPPPDAVLLRGDDLGVLEDATRRLARVPLPATLAGLPRRSIEGAPPAIGLYGRGVTLLAVVPVPDRLAGELQRAAAQSPTAVRDQLGTRLAAGPLGIMLVGAPGRTTYLLTGTVTLDALAQAAGQLPDLDGRP
jgi:hypothetical protein